MSWFEWKMKAFDEFNSANVFLGLCLAVTYRNLKSGSRASSGSFRLFSGFDLAGRCLVSRYDNLSVLVSLMSNMSMPASFFVLLHSDTVGLLLGWSAAFSGWVTGVTCGVTNLHVLV